MSQHQYICCADALYPDPCNAGRYARKAIRDFPKGASCLSENACGSHSRWHRSCTHEGYQGMASSVRPVSLERNQRQDGMLSHYGWHWLSCSCLWEWTDLSWFRRTSGSVCCAEMFHQLPVREAGVCLQDHKDDLCTGTEYIPAAQMGFRQTGGFRHTLKRKDRMKSAQAHSCQNSCDIFPEYQIL